MMLKSLHLLEGNPESESKKGSQAKGGCKETTAAKRPNETRKKMKRSRIYEVRSGNRGRDASSNNA